MKLGDIMEEKKEQEGKGTYVGVKFSKDTKDRLKEYMKKNDIPNPLPRDKMHTTVIYSRKRADDIKPHGKIDPPWIGKPESMEIFKTRDENNALVLRYKCKKLSDRHQYIMDKHDTTYDWPEFKIHVTLSYDCGDIDLDSLSDVKDIGDIEIVEEYKEDLELDWNNKK